MSLNLLACHPASFLKSSVVLERSSRSVFIRKSLEIKGVCGLEGTHPALPRLLTECLVISPYRPWWSSPTLCTSVSCGMLGLDRLLPYLRSILVFFKKKKITF